MLITDGYDENSRDRLDEVLAALKAADVIVYTMAIGGVPGVSLQGEQMLRGIAAADRRPRVLSLERQGGRRGVRTAIAEDAQHRYRVTYTPANQRHDGAWRAIRLETRTPHYTGGRPRRLHVARRPSRSRRRWSSPSRTSPRQHVEVGRDDLTVLEDGVPQKVESFHESVAPVSVMLALDASGSMTSVVPAVQEAAHTFVTR